MLKELEGREDLPMKAYVVVTARAGTAREIADAMAALPGVQMADACWGGGDLYAVVESRMESVQRIGVG